MKKIIICALTIMLASASVKAEVVRDGNTFTQVTNKTEVVAKDTGFKYQPSKDSKEYPIYLSKNGRAYIFKVSKNGNEYKQYLGEKISREICRELGVDYVEKTK